MKDNGMIMRSRRGGPGQAYRTRRHCLNYELRGGGLKNAGKWPPASWRILLTPHTHCLPPRQEADEHQEQNHQTEMRLLPLIFSVVGEESKTA
ncbi:hypothetical protein ILYODFUR_012333 [Ilyodon furcidens]|uniref:Uncharacterized protein n=1 Tax=Ilyodon furcidens TaxID=33524 RepID=A0ABV0TJ81_9TELE